MSLSLRYRVVDVFTERALEGNALAVFTDARGLDEAWMQKIARELNLSETVFVFPSRRPDCAAHLRIFTTASEMTFAGHPTVGAAWVLLDEGIVAKGTTRFSLQEPVGPVPVRVDDGDNPMVWLTTPPVRHWGSYDRRMVADFLGLKVTDLLGPEPQLWGAGNPNLFVALRDPATVDRVSVDRSAFGFLFPGAAYLPCIFSFAPVPAGAYSRMFALEHTVIEDPATGGATGPLAVYMMHHGLMATADGTAFVSEQGTRMGRRSLLHVLIHGENGENGIEVGGHVTPLAEGTMHLDLS